jgi:hypothetical protein
MADLLRNSLIKPGLKTPFHIDFDWWKEMDQNWRVDLKGLLCEEHQKTFIGIKEDQMIDWIDPVTAEVKQIDGLHFIVTSHCALQQNFLNEHTTLVDAVFRVLISSGNIPISAEELGKKLGRQPDILLKTLAGPRVYKGIRPFLIS